MLLLPPPPLLPQRLLLLLLLLVQNLGSRGGPVRRQQIQGYTTSLLQTVGALVVAAADEGTAVRHRMDSHVYLLVAQRHQHTHTERKGRTQNFR